MTTTTGERATGLGGVELGTYTIHAEFFTEHLAVGGEISSPEARLSDLLNSSAPTLDMSPLYVARAAGGQVDVAGRVAHVNKSRLLFVVPISEPPRPQGSRNAAWRETQKWRCWGALGAYSLVGTLHTDLGADPRFLLRLLDLQFAPFTAATVTFPNGTVRDYPVVIVNRHYLEFLSLR
jgi:hypothetical protein